jgi:dTDP-4-amino-4,6-dideoxygalactose transaminase
MMRKRKANAEYLAEHLGDEYNDNHAYMMYPYYSLYRDELMLYMEKKGITTRTVMPLISQPYIKKTLGEIKYPFAELIGKKGLLFGCHQDLTNKDLDYIVKTIKEFNDNH